MTSYSKLINLKSSFSFCFKVLISVYFLYYVYVSGDVQLIFDTSVIKQNKW